MKQVSCVIQHTKILMILNLRSNLNCTRQLIIYSDICLSRCLTRSTASFFFFPFLQKIQHLMCVRNFSEERGINNMFFPVCICMHKAACDGGQRAFLVSYFRLYKIIFQLSLPVLQSVPGMG